MKTPIYGALVVALAFLSSCGSEQQKEHKVESKVAVKGHYHFTSPDRSDKHYLNDTIQITIDMVSADAVAWDSVILTVDGEPIGSLGAQSKTINWASRGKGLGSHQVHADVYAAGKRESVSSQFIIFSDEKPEEYTYRVIKTYPHDEQAFTQGLIYSEGYFYEGTGQKGASELRKVALENGEVLQRKVINSTLFGEGITLINDHIYQLTWQAGLGLVYDKNTFEEVSRFYYQDEGWGLTHNANALIMSDGSNKIRFLDPGDFHLIREVRVYDQNGAIGYINELEWIDDLIYANIWQRDEIIMIDPETGKVKGKINMNGLWPNNRPKPGVLNGIAYDAAGSRLFVTGKYWPILFQIEVIKKTTSS